jgi:TonB family protein
VTIAAALILRLAPLLQLHPVRNQTVSTPCEAVVHGLDEARELIMRAIKKLCIAGCVAGALSSLPAFAQTEPPKIKTFVPADYPPAAQSAGVEGEVTFELVIEVDGTVSSAIVIKSGGFGFDEAALIAVKKFIFTPATQNGTPVRSTVSYRYRFNLIRENKGNPLLAPLDNGQQDPSPENLAGVDISEILPPGEIRGQVLERGARVFIENAQVFIIQSREGKPVTREALADEKGRFVVTGLVPGTCTIKVIATDYETLTVEEVVPDGGALELTLRITPTVEQGYGLVVRGAKEEQEVTRRVVTADELASLPGTQGDVLKGLQNIPGFARAPLDSGLLVVRGSAPEDTQTFLNGMPIPLIYHFGGLTSVLPNNILTQIEFLPGVYSAKYGRGMGGIIDAQSQPGKNNELHGSVETDVFDTGLFLQGPIGDKGASFAVAGRRSYIDTLLPLSFRIAEGVSDQDISTGFTIAPRYWDYQAAAGADLLNGKGQLIIFGSDDQLTLTVDDPSLGDQFFSTRTFFHRIQGIWSREIAPGLTQRAAVSAGFTRLAFAAPPLFTFNIDSYLMTGRVDWAKKINEKLALAYGVDTQWNFFDVSILFPGENNTNIETEIKGNQPDAAVYTEARYLPIDGVQIIPGLRLDYFGLTDSFTVDPRFAARWQINAKSTVKLGAGIFHQAPQPQDADATFGNPNIGNQQSEQVSVGFEQGLWNNRLNFDATLYYKHLSDLVVQNGAGDSFEEITTNDGSGRVRGLEVLLRYPPSARLFGWLAYSLTRAERKDSPEDEEFRLFGFDQTHIITALASYKLAAGFSAGFRFRYATGTPDTPILGGIYDADSDSYISLPGETNSERVPAFHQLDLRIDKTFRKDRYSIDMYLEVLNVYNRKNPEGFFYNFDFTQKGTFTGLPILPVLGVRGEF